MNYTLCGGLQNVNVSRSVAPQTRQGLFDTCEETDLPRHLAEANTSIVESKTRGSSRMPPLNQRWKLLHQLTTDDGPKFPNPWLVRRIVALQIAKTPRAPRSMALPVQSI